MKQGKQTKTPLQSKVRKLAIWGLCIFLLSLFLPVAVSYIPIFGFNLLLESIEDIFEGSLIAAFPLCAYLLMIILPLLVIKKYTLKAVPMSLLGVQVLLFVPHIYYFSIGAHAIGIYLQILSVGQDYPVDFSSSRHKKNVDLVLLVPKPLIIMNVVGTNVLLFRKIKLIICFHGKC